MKIEKELDVCYNLDYLVIVPTKDKKMYEDFDYTFGNVLLFENSVEDTEFLVKFIRKNLVGQLIFVDYYVEYDEIISTLVDEHDIKFIFTGALGELSNEFVWGEFEKICEKYDRGEIKTIGFTDPFLYEAMKIKHKDIERVLLDRENMVGPTTKSGRTIGILNACDCDYASFYNEMGGLSVLREYRAKLYYPMREVLDFARDYGIEYEIVKDPDILIEENVCNLDVNFAGAQVSTFLKSMDFGVPCVVGNNSFLSDEYPVMSEYLVLKSDDDIDEVADKVRAAIDNKKAIMEEYGRFRLKYSKEARDLAERFLGFKLRKREDAKNGKLLTVVVPVYNTEQYLVDCLDSVIRAGIPSMEILIINDGSTDDSEKIAKEYVERYPNLVRYIKQKNHGLGNVRNVGLLEAEGKYIASVDSDDTIEQSFLKEASVYLENDVDVVVCDWMSVGGENRFETAALDYVFEDRIEYLGIMYTTIMPSTCNKIIKKSLFLNGGIKYLEQKYEDLSANPLALLDANTIKYIHRPYYNYYLRDNSLMRSGINPRHMVDALKYLDVRLKIRNKAMDEEEFKFYVYSWRIEEYIINPLYEMDEKDLNEVVEYIYDNVYYLMKDIFENKYYKKMLGRLRSKELRDFVRKRNEMFNEKKLGEFVLSIDGPQKITASIVYYGD